ncbi:MAG: acetylxylan esterase [Acetivibrio ethanolgignens]
MPTRDIPLCELREYKGITPKPADFWEFWDKRVEEAFCLPLTWEIRPSEIKATSETEFYDIWLKGVRGAKLYAKYVKPVREEKVPVILQFHGYPGASRGWFEQAAFAGMGMAVLAMECPGQGGFSEELGGRKGTTAADHIIMGLDGRPEELYYVDVFMDTCLMVRLAMELPGLDKERIYVNGASQGAALGLVCTALNPTHICRCAALYPFLSDYRRAWEMDRDIIVYDGLKYYTKWFDPQGERLEESFTKLGYIDVQNFVERISCPVLFGTGLMDEACPPSSQFAVFSKIRAPKKHYVFPEYGHEEIAVFDDKLISFFGRKEDALCLE